MIPFSFHDVIAMPPDAGRTHNHHKHHGAEVDDDEEEGNHGKCKDPSDPPVLPSIRDEKK